MYSSILVICTLVGVVVGQYPQMMPFPQRPNINAAAAMMRMRSPIMPNRQRWPPLINQPQALQPQTLAQRPYKPMFMYMKGPPPLYRTQKPLASAPNPYPNYWKAPINFRPSGVKDVFRTPPSPAVQTSAKLSPVPASAQKLLAASSPVQNLIIGPSPIKNLLTGVPKKYTYSNAIVTTTQKYQTSQPLTGPQPTTSSVAYPIKVEGEGGPIHTIPAPNLSLADKPIVVPEFGYIDTHSNKFTSGHTYEVTEESSEKAHHDQALDQSKLFSLGPSSSKLSPGKSYFSSAPQHPFLPQASALRAQPIAPSLTSHELFALLSGSPGQQQLADTYTLPLVQQPQLQQHFIHHPYSNVKPIQAFSAVYQPYFGGVNAQENVLFKPDPNYLKKIQQQLIQSTIKPEFQSFNYQEPKRQVLSLTDSDKLKTSLEQALRDDTDVNSVHYNVIRNTKEGVPHVKKSSPEIVIGNSSIIGDSETSASYNVGTNINFVSNETADAVASMFLSEIDNIATSSLPPEYIAKLKNKNKESNPQYNPIQYDFNPYFAQNTPDIQPIKNQKYNNDFTPNNGLPYMMQENIKSQDSQAPIRIMVPEQYDDINTQPTENIQVSASLNAREESKNDMTIVFDSDHNDDNYQQYDEQDSESDMKSTDSNILSSDYSTESSIKNPDDVVVVVPQNNTNPTLDILTKDWKTSIIIKPKPAAKTNSRGAANQITEFGNRIKPK